VAAERCDYDGVKLRELLQKQQHGALTAAQVHELAGAMPEQYRPLITFLADTGLRIGEALGQRWCNVNLEDAWKIAGQTAIAPNSLLVRENGTRGERITFKPRA